MKRRFPRVALAAAVGLGFGLLSAPLALAETSFPLSCRGGAKMTIRFQDENLEHVNRFSFFFERGGVGANEALPGAGECAFLDRAVSADEPNRVEWRFKGAFTVLDVGGDGVVTGWDIGGWYGEARQKLRSLLDGIFEGKSFTLHVRIAGRGDNRYFEVVRVGP